MIKEILLPDLGEGIDSAEVSEVTVSQGDTVGICLLYTSDAADE